MKGYSGKVFLLFFLFFFVINGFNYADPPGSKDHPLLSRYPGSVIIYYSQKGFDEFYFLKAPKGKTNYTLKDCKRGKVEGKITRIIYRIPLKRSAYEVFKNYEYAVKNAGFKIITSLRTKNIRDFVEKIAGFPGIWGFGSEKNGDHFYFVAVSPQKDIYVSVYVGEGYRGRPGKAAVGIAEVKSMETGLISSKKIGDTIRAAGHIALYGIHFDFNKAVLKPESLPVIKEIAKYLKENPEVKLYVVGHTDNVGKFEYNMKLSLERAKAVVKELIEKHGISPDRLKAFGVGPLAPVASNKTDQGRAKNRRVELVEQ